MLENDTIPDYEDSFPVDGVSYTTGMNVVLNETIEDDYVVTYDDDGNEIEDTTEYSVIGDKSLNFIISGSERSETNKF